MPSEKQKKRFSIIKIIGIIVGFLLILTILYALAAFYITTSQIRNYRVYWNEVAEKNTEADVRYIALGNSAAQAVGASGPEKGYVGLLASTIKSEFPDAQIINLSVSGARVADALRVQVPQLQDYNPTPNDIITLEIGANNIGSFDAVSFEQEMTTLLDVMPPQTIVADIPYFGGGRARSGESAANKASIIIRRLASERDLRVAELEAITTQNESIKNYSIDFFHPSDRAYRLWAESFKPYVKDDIMKISTKLQQ